MATACLCATVDGIPKCGRHQLIRSLIQRLVIAEAELAHTAGQATCLLEQIPVSTQQVYHQPQARYQRGDLGRVGSLLCDDTSKLIQELRPFCVAGTEEIPDMANDVDSLIVREPHARGGAPFGNLPTQAQIQD